jgi:hypothetical protein
MLRVRYPKVTGQIFDALGIYDTYNQDFGVLIAVRLFLGGSNTYSDPIPVADVDVIGGIGGGGGSGVSSINGIGGSLNIAAGSGIDVTTSGNTLTITATGGTVTNEAIDDRVAALLQAGPNISLNYNDAANTLTISASGSGGVTSFNGRTGAVVPPPNDYSYTDIANFDVGVDNRIALIASTTQPATLFPTFNENVDDRVAALLQAGQGLTKTYNDAANSLTLAVTNANLLNKTTIGSFPPSSPVPGDIWFETSDAGGAYVGDTTARVWSAKARLVLVVGRVFLAVATLPLERLCLKCHDCEPSRQMGAFGHPEFDGGRIQSLVSECPGQPFCANHQQCRELLVAHYRREYGFHNSEHC